MARPRKPLGLLLIKGTYRRDRHGALPGSGLESVTTPPEPEPRLSPTARFYAFQALPADVRAWEGFLDLGDDFFSELPPGVTEAKARRMARAKWREHGRELFGIGAQSARANCGHGGAGARPGRTHSVPLVDLPFLYHVPGLYP